MRVDDISGDFYFAELTIFYLDIYDFSINK